MVAEPKVIPVDPESELGHILDEAAAGDVILDKAGMRFRLIRQADDPFANYDPERALAAFERAAGIFDGMDIEELKAELRAQRSQDSIGRPGW